MACLRIWKKNSKDTRRWRKAQRLKTEQCLECEFWLRIFCTNYYYSSPKVEEAKKSEKNELKIQSLARSRREKEGVKLHFLADCCTARSQVRMELHLFFVLFFLTCTNDWLDEEIITVPSLQRRSHFSFPLNEQEVRKNWQNMKSTSPFRHLNSVATARPSVNPRVISNCAQNRPFDKYVRVCQ